MAVTHYTFDQTKPHGFMLRRAMQQLEEGTENLADLLGSMALMIDGDGSDAAHFTAVTSRFGFADNASAKAVWEELNSLNSKFTTNNAVTDVQAAMAQAFAKLR